MVSQIDIARVVGVSQRTVSAVLCGRRGSAKASEATARQVLEVAKSLGYRPNQAARQLRGDPSGILGVISGPLVHQTQARLLAVVADAGRSLNYRIMTSQVDEDMASVCDYVDDLEARRVEGVICLKHSHFTDTDTVPRRLARIPSVVYLGRPDQVAAGGYVERDFAEGTRRAIEHLRQRGRTRIGMALAAAPSTSSLEARRDAYLEAMGGDAGRMWLGDGPSDPSPQAIEAIAEDLILRRRADAVLASNDVWAVSLIKHLKARGVRVPEDVAIVGFDNSDVAWASDPGVTTVGFDENRVGRALVEMVHAMIAGGGRLAPDQRVVRLEPVLVVRDST